MSYKIFRSHLQNSWGRESLPPPQSPAAVAMFGSCSKPRAASDIHHHCQAPSDSWWLSVSGPKWLSMARPRVALNCAANIYSWATTCNSLHKPVLPLGPECLLMCALAAAKPQEALAYADAVAETRVYTTIMARPRMTLHICHQDPTL